jgi:hypothetical protein
MEFADKTAVAFRSSAFNMSEPKEYFINACCFGDDVAKWLTSEMRNRGYEVFGEPGQEDFGWYLKFRVLDVDYFFIIGHQPGNEDNDPGVWLGWIQRAGFSKSILGLSNRRIHLAAVRAIHEILFNSPLVTDIRWHILNEDWETGTPEPF